MNIDLMGSTTPNDSDIANAMQMIIDRKYTAAQREQLSRGTAAQKKELTDFYASMSGIKASIVADRDLLKATLAHEQAVALSATTPLDSKATDADGKLLYPPIEVMNITTGKSTGKSNPHPALVMDTETRKQAAATVKGASAAVIALAKKRLPSKVEDDV